MSKNNKKKPLILSTLILFMAVAVVTVYSLVPNNEVKELEMYNVKFDSDGGNSIAAIEIEEGKSLNELPEDPTREGYIFIGWMLGDELYDFSQGINDDITLKAGWKKIEADKVYYTVSFNTDGGTTYANQVIEEGEVATRPSTYPTKEGFTFTGWQLDGVDYDFSLPVTKDITITALWEENKPEVPVEPEDPNKTYTVRFDAAGGVLGNGCGEQSVKTGTRANNSCQVTRNGYTFTGWSPNITRNITADTTFRAQWKQNQVTPPVPEKQYLTVKFNANGGNISCPNAVRVESGTSVSSALSSGGCNPNRTNYSLSGWSTSANGGGNVTTLTGSNSIVLYAQWKPNTFNVRCPIIDSQTQACDLQIINATTGQKLSNATAKLYFNGRPKTYSIGQPNTLYTVVSKASSNAEVVIGSETFVASFVGN